MTSPQPGADSEVETPVRRGRARFRLPLPARWFVFAALVAGGVALFYGRRRATLTDRLLEHALDKMAEEAHRTALALESFVAGASAAAELVASGEGTRVLVTAEVPGPPARVERHSRTLTRIAKRLHLGALAVVGADGRLRSASAGIGPLDSASRAAVATAIRTSAPVLIGPTADGSHLVAIAHPVLRDAPAGASEVVGAVIALIDAEESLLGLLHPFVEDTRTGVTTFVDAQGLVVAWPDQSPAPPWLELAHARAPPGGTRPADPERGVLDGVDGERVAFTSHPVARTPWTALRTMAVSEIRAPALLQARWESTALASGLLLVIVAWGETVRSVTARRTRSATGWVVAARREANHTRGRLEAIASATADPMFLKDREGRYIWVNRAAWRLSGEHPEALLGRTAEELLDAEAAAQVRQDDEDVMRTGEIRTRDVALVDVDGVRIFHDEKAPWVDDHGEVLGVASVARDVTEQRDAERTLALEVTRVTALLDAIPDLVFRTDPSGVILDFHGGPTLHNPDDIVGRSVMELLPPPSNRIVQDAIEQTASTGRGRTFEVSVEFPDGVRHFEETQRLAGSGEVLRVVRDVTDRVEAQRRLTDSTRRFRQALEAAHAGAWSWDIDTNQVFWSDENYRLLGLDPESTAPTYERWLESVHPDDRRIAHEHVRTAVASGADLQMEYRVVLPDGTERWIRDVGRFEPDPTGESSGSMHGLQIDITARKRAERELAALMFELDRRVSDRTAELEAVVFTLSHDLKAPLRWVERELTRLARSSKPSHQETDTLCAARQRVRRMGSLLEHLLKLARLGRVDLRRSYVDATRLARSALLNLEKDGVAFDGEVRIHTLPMIQVDRLLMREVFWNLLSNAIKFSATVERPVIDVSSYDADGEHVFLVRDNGVGFNPRYRAKLFKLFERLHDGDDFPGDGVGLAVVERVVRRHGGRVWAESSPGSGASFFFTVPAHFTDDAA